MRLHSLDSLIQISDEHDEMILERETMMIETHCDLVEQVEMIHETTLRRKDDELMSKIEIIEVRSHCLIVDIIQIT